MSSSLLYDLKSDDYYSGANLDLFKLVEGDIYRVLDIGCSEGKSAAYFRNIGVKVIWGVEMSASAAEQAKQQMDYVYMGTIESFFESEHVENRFDLIILGDVLEHLINPWLVLKQLTGLLSKNGQILISLPNIRNMGVLVPLLIKGEWRYEMSGILDNTHLRFFTYKSAVRMIHDAGLFVAKVSSNRFGGKSGFFNQLTLGLFKEFFITQHYFLCRRRKLL